jgi:hypothetical protein
MNQLPDSEERQLRRRRQELLAELARLELAIRGCAFERYSVCSRPGCRCHRGEKHGPRCYVVVTAGKRQRQHYVPQAQVEAVQEGVRQSHRFLALLDALTAVNLALMRGGRLGGEPSGDT